MTKSKENIYNLPNALSLYRIIAIPFIIWKIYQNNSDCFIVLISINLVSDILDGWIARKYQLHTDFGAKLDSIADIGTYLMAFIGMIVLQPEFIEKYRSLFIGLIAMWVIPQIICFIKFKRFPSLHLWSNKVLGYIQGIFIFLLFTIGEINYYFYFMLACSFLAYLEELLVILILHKLHSNVKSIFLLNRLPNN